MGIVGVKKFEVTVEGLTPILYNNEAAMLTIPKKDKKTSYEEHEQQYWLHKSYVTADKDVAIPSMWIFKTLVVSQKSDAVPIKPAAARKASATLKDTIISSAYCEDAIVYKDEKMTEPLKQSDLIQFMKGVNRGTFSSPKKVIVVRPQTPGQNWYTKFVITMTDASIMKEHIEEIFGWAGTRNGLGDWRPSRGGRYGMYRLISVTEV